MKGSHKKDKENVRGRTEETEIGKNDAEDDRRK